MPDPQREEWRDALHALRETMQTLTTKVEVMSMAVEMRATAEEKSRNAIQSWLKALIPTMITLAIGLGIYINTVGSRVDSIDKFGTAYGREQSVAKDTAIADLQKEVLLLKQQQVKK